MTIFNTFLIYMIFSFPIILKSNRAQYQSDMQLAIKCLLLFDKRFYRHCCSALCSGDAKNERGDFIHNNNNSSPWRFIGGAVSLIMIIKSAAKFLEAFKLSLTSLISRISTVIIYNIFLEIRNNMYEVPFYCLVNKYRTGNVLIRHFRQFI